MFSKSIPYFELSKIIFFDKYLNFYLTYSFNNLFL